jgi:hypothetical protein
MDKGIKKLPAGSQHICYVLSSKISAIKMPPTMLALYYVVGRRYTEH